MFVNSTLLKKACFECGSISVEKADAKQNELVENLPKRARLDDSVKKIINISTCIQCLNATYCSKDCQTKAWPHHKKVCVKDKALNINVVKQSLTFLIGACAMKSVDLKENYIMVWFRVDTQGKLIEKDGHYELVKPPILMKRKNFKNTFYENGIVNLTAENKDVFVMDVNCVSVQGIKQIIDPRYRAIYIFSP